MTSYRTKFCGFCRRLTDFLMAPIHGREAWKCTKCERYE